MPFHTTFHHNHSDLILQDDFRAKLNEENSLILDTVDTSVVFKRETVNANDVITGIDDDLDNLLFKTVNAQLHVGSRDHVGSLDHVGSQDHNITNQSTNHRQKIHLSANSTEFGEFSCKLNFNKTRKINVSDF